jgi:hypothetical protein
MNVYLCILPGLMFLGSCSISFVVSFQCICTISYCACAPFSFPFLFFASRTTSFVLVHHFFSLFDCHCITHHFIRACASFLLVWVFWVKYTWICHIIITIMITLGILRLFIARLFSNCYEISNKMYQPICSG